MILNVTFAQIAADISVQFSEEDAFSVGFGELSELPPGDVPIYEGSHQVVPSFFDQLLDTSGLLLEEDIRVEPIPLARVTNTSGGTTVIIGG